MIVWKRFGMFSCEMTIPSSTVVDTADGTRNVKSLGLPRHPMRLSM